ncbi:kinase-like domain-containing protein [Polychytrium aggregatum]|uniref:kinase-like domain-containing protein n=1 Tax=Polychytrium aggregatum TaxID=110093 RepID=UPI0022FDD534|nr:kinase-like domain-containing protein [Polychytrium aggregatum]KAI9203046.1 kinase-like domain-containing protein [Polychytrium aggregatum]
MMLHVKSPSSSLSLSAHHSCLYPSVGSSASSASSSAGASSTAMYFAGSQDLREASKPSAHFASADSAATLVCTSDSSRYTLLPGSSRIETALSSIEFAIDSTTSQHVVLKRSLDDLASMDHELEMLRLIKDHGVPNVTTVIDTFVDGDSCSVVVFPKLKKLDCPSSVSLLLVRNVLKSLLQTLLALHALDVAHLDLCLANVMQDPITNQPVLIDFGLSRRSSPTDPHPRGCGTPGYIAPEVQHGTSFGTECDIFSLGVIFGQWLHVYLPRFPDSALRCLGSGLLFPGQIASLVPVIQQYIRDERSHLDAILISAAELLALMLKEDPRDRITASKCLSHLFLVASDRAFSEFSLAKAKTKAQNLFYYPPSPRRSEQVVYWR